MPSITIVASEVDPSIFDYAAHVAKGEALGDQLEQAKQRLPEAELAAEAAIEAEEELDILTDSNAKMTKVRLDRERAAAVLAQAERQLRSLERQASQLNTDTHVAEALLPVARRLTRDHSGYTVMVLPAEPNWGNVPAQSLVLVQPGKTYWREGGAVSTREEFASRASNEQRVVITHVLDKGFHREILSADSIRNACAGIVGLTRKDRPLHNGELSPREHELKSGLTASVVSLEILSVYPQTPVIEHVNRDISGPWLIDALEGGLRSLAFQSDTLPASVGVGEIQFAESVDADGVRTLKVSAGVEANNRMGERVPIGHAVARLVGQVRGGLGRVVEARSIGSSVSVKFQSKTGPARA